MDFEQDEPCEQCGIAWSYVEDGRWYCRNGHDRGRTVTGEDEQDFLQRGNIVRKRETKEKQRMTKVLHGIKAYQLFLQSWQFILWKQCHTLVHRKGLPPDLWTIVRDLWTLWLSRLEHRLQESPDPEALPDPESEEELGLDAGNETDTDLETDGESQWQKKHKSTCDSPTLVDTVALTYLGVILLRRTIGLATMLRWIQQEDIPFIRAIRHVPPEMKDRLPGEYQMSLDTMSILQPDDLQKAVFHCAVMYSSSFGMILPPVNHNLFLLQYIRSLALPVEVYSTARRLNTVTTYAFSYPHRSQSDSTRRQPTTYPEAQLMSLVVIATKLLFPFDPETVKRYPKRNNDPTTLKMNWSAWLDAKVSFDQNSSATDPAGLKSGSEIHITDHDIMEMTDEQLDQYMDWYQRTWITSAAGAQSQKSPQSGIDRDILDMFPLYNLPEPIQTRERNEQAEGEERDRLEMRIRAVQSSLTSRRAISIEEEAERGLEILRPGAKYLHLRNIADLDRADKVVKIFHEEAAQTACLSVKALLRAVNRSEEKIEQWLKDRRREDVFGDEEEEENPVEEGEEGISLATSPPNASANLIRDLSGLEIGQSPDVQGDEDVGMESAMEMLSET
ncbi:uncharacterized protein Z518_07573 [Rhinocladiella mackenziei CBS 650.93]|uniref:RRN7-type domain-containing protein n=1 Tax=Rhinocladiella mackenziei CBS 650.93 TaxID=1442369 RepID=A0A0D2J4W5_9EURO|nr:uncharacterized protein Z518_07573 [Rhinocladiella mackenziei CBS 650.93]KIX04020.1 hypothetical protein Z518_07573 [Rhinocladiella mackenziei CBS 650.93]